LALFNHFVGDQQKVARYRQAESLGGLEIDGNLKLGRKLDRQVGGLGAFVRF